MGGWALEELADSQDALDTTAKNACPANALEARGMHPEREKFTDNRNMPI